MPLRAQIDIHAAAAWPGQWCLLARHDRRTDELAFYRSFSPRPVPMSELARVAGRRWTIEETFRASKGPTGLDERGSDLPSPTTPHTARTGHTGDIGIKPAPTGATSDITRPCSHPARARIDKPAARTDNDSSRLRTTS